MNKTAAIVAASWVFLAGSALADTATGQATGKRQHKPLPAAEAEEEQPTRVRKGMQDLKNNAQDPEPAMNKKEMAEKLAKKADVSETRMNKSELTETMASDAGLSKADSKRASGDKEKTDKNEAARSKRKKDR